MSAKAQQRNRFETLTLGLLVAGLVLATLLMLWIAWRWWQHDLTSEQLAARLEERQKVYQALTEQLGRHETRAQKLEAAIDAEQRRRAEQKELERQAELQKAQERQKQLAEEEQRRRNTPAEHMKHGDQALREGRLQDAYKRYSAVLQVEPQNARAWANRGLAQHRMRRSEQGLDDLGRAVQADPRDAYVFQTRAGVLLEVDRDRRAEEALADCDRALQLGGTESLLHYYRGAALQALGRLEEALEAYRTAEPMIQPSPFKRVVLELIRHLEGEVARQKAAAEQPPG